MIQQQLVCISAHRVAVKRFSKTAAHSNRLCHTARVWSEEVQEHQALNFLWRLQGSGTEMTLVLPPLTDPVESPTWDWRLRLIDYQEAGKGIWGSSVHYS